MRHSGRDRTSLGRQACRERKRGSGRPFMPASPPNTASPFEPNQFHSEFGYFAPTMRFRRKAALTVKAAALGAIVGAVAVFVVVMDREEKAFTMVSTSLPSTAGSPASPPPATSTPAQARPVQATQVQPTPVQPTQAPPMRAASAPVSPMPVSPMPTPATPALAMQMSSKPGSSAPPATRGAASARVVAAKGWPQVPFVPESVALPAAVPVVVPATAPATPTV